MARFDVYSNPDPAERKVVPYFLDLQNDFIDGLETRVAAPLRVAHSLRLRLRDLHPELEVEGKKVIMDTPALAAIPVRELRRPVANLSAQRHVIQDALDTLFGGW